MSTLSRADADVLEQIAKLHEPDPDGGMGYRTVEGTWSYGTIEPACRTCGTSDEYAVQWPCQTRLLLDKINAKVAA